MKKILIPALLCLTFAAGCTCENTIRRRADVLVIGGTTSGTTAAIAAARQGVQTLVVEETPMLGGMLTAQGVCATDGNFNLPSGLWNEFRDHLRKRYGGIGALWTGWVSTTLFEPHVADSIFHTMAAAEPTLEVVHGYRLTGILRRGKRVTGAEFTDARGGRMLVRARITVDATDLGDALPLSGTSYRLGMTPAPTRAKSWLRPRPTTRCRTSRWWPSSRTTGPARTEPSSGLRATTPRSSPGVTTSRRKGCAAPTGCSNTAVCREANT